MALPLRRQMGNAQSRQTALGQAPQYGATTNPNGAQTASAYDPMRQPPTGISPQNPAWMASRQEAARMQPVQQMAPAAPAPAYPGGDVAGQAQYYRNTALGQYRPPGSSNQAAGLVNSLQPGTNMGDPRFSGLNGYDTFSAQIADPNRLTPDQKFQSAIGSAQRMGAYDPTNQGGNRFSGSANRVLASQASDQAAIAAGTQAEQQRMQGIAANSPERAMDPDSQSRAFAYQDPQRGMVATNRLGQLQQLQKQFPNDAQVAMSVADERLRQSALGQRQEDFQSRYAAAHGGLGDKASRSLKNQGLVRNRAARLGIITPEGAAARNAAGANKALDSQTFRESEQKARRSGLNAQYQGQRQEALGRDNARLPNGQLRDEVRQAARSQVDSLMTPRQTASPVDQFHSQVVRAAGLTGDPKEDTPIVAAEKIFANGITSPEQAIAFQKYWIGMIRSDSKWLENTPGAASTFINGAMGGTVINASIAEKMKVLNEMADVPPEEMQNWFDQNQDRLGAIQQSAFSGGPAAGRFGSTPMLPFAGH